MIVKIINGKNIQNFDIDKDTLILGRSSGCDIQVDSQFVSREHLEISKNYYGDIFIKDISSNNWVSYNNEQIEKNEAVQYFAFAVLVLPGDFVVEIITSADENSSENRSLTEFTGSTSKTFRNKETTLADIDKQMDEKLKMATLNASIVSTQKSSNSRRKLIPIFLIVIAVGVGFVLMKGKELSPPPPTKVETKTKEKEIKKPIQKNEIKAVKKPVKSDYDKIREMQKKYNCNNSFLKRICLTVLYSRGKTEGVFREGQTLYIVKDRNQRLEMLFKGSPEKIAGIKNHSSANKIIAGEKILFPQFLEELEGQKIYTVKIIVTDGISKKMKIVDRYTIETAFYRRYETEDYKNAYLEISKSLNINSFQRNLGRFISKD